MLKLKVKIHNQDEYDEIKYNELFIAPDDTFVSGTTDFNPNLKNATNIYIEANKDNNFVPYRLSNVNHVLRQGYVIYKEDLKLEYYLPEGLNGPMARCVKYLDGKYYFITDDKVTINNKEYEVEYYVIIDNVKHKIESNLIQIEGQIYNVINNQVIVDGVKYTVKDGVVVIGNLTYNVISRAVVFGPTTYKVIDDAVFVDGVKYTVKDGAVEINEKKYYVKSNVVKIGYKTYDVINNQIIVDGVKYTVDENNLVAIDGYDYKTETNVIILDPHIEEVIKDTVTVDNVTYNIEEGIVKQVECKYWVEDGVLSIHQNDYPIDISLTRIPIKDGNGNISSYEYRVDHEPYVVLKDKTKLYVQESDKKYWKKITTFRFDKESDLYISIDYASLTSKENYFMYGNKEVTFTRDNNGEYYATTYDNKVFKQSFDYAIESTKEIEKYKLQSKWVASNNSCYIILYADNTIFPFSVGNEIIAYSNSPTKNECNVEFEDNTQKFYVIYNGDKYYMQNNTKDFAIINNKKYFITYVDDEWYCPETIKYNKDVSDIKYGYITLNNVNSPLIIFKYLNKYYKCILYSIESQVFNSQQSQDLSDKNKFCYHVEKKEYFIINDKEYFVDNFAISKVINKKPTQITFKTITIVDIIKVKLLVIDMISSNALICQLKSNIADSSNVVLRDIAINHKNYSFLLYRPIYAVGSSSKARYFYEYYINSVPPNKIALFLKGSSLSLKLPFATEIANNLNQDDIVINDFSRVERQQKINPIVDMEKEIYYPVYFNNENKTFNNIDEIKFNLHFRSRNLNNWKVNEYGTSDSLNDNNTNSQKYNWNYFDNYYCTNDKTMFSDGNNVNNKAHFYCNDKFAYHQPSDLLYFLKFTNDDVYYQKSKLAKSFIRLSFFNSNDIENQSLLYTCTVFIDAHHMFQKYINSMQNKNDKFIKLSNYSQKNNQYYYHMDVDSEILSDNLNDSEQIIDFNEEKRLSASFSVYNRYISHSSSEGFYLHIFKEYCERLHEEPIYMKIDFNHAGVGRTVNLTIPFNITTNENGEDVYRLLNLNDENDIKIFKEGVPLSELYKHIFIPLESVYDEKNMRYVYYLPEWMNNEYENNETKISYNLYEIKIKDES